MNLGQAWGCPRNHIFPGSWVAEVPLRALSAGRSRFPAYSGRRGGRRGRGGN